jgi:hypothetical protein
MPRGSGMSQTRRRRLTAPIQAPTRTIADMFKARLGYQNTADNRRCVRCFEMLPDAAFDVPFTPAQPLTNICRGCVSRPQLSELAEAINRRICDRTP